jgi:MazG family protein
MPRRLDSGNPALTSAARSFRLVGLMPSTGERFERAVSIMARLRAPGGCPWDREQTFDTIKPFTIEETYEVIEAIDNRAWDELPGELGDLLLQVLFYAQMADEEKRFSIDDVLDALSNKLVARHPHVFGDVTADTSAEVLRNWEKLKQREREQGGEGKPGALLDSVSAGIPALLEASKLGSKAAGVGFDWPNIEGLFAKLHEEIAELRAHLEEFPAPGPRPTNRGVAGSGAPQISEDLRLRLEDELGDLFFVLVNIARHLQLDSESALKRTNRKFRRRFGWLEQRLRAQGKQLEDVTLEDMEALWQQAKQHETR